MEYSLDLEWPAQGYTVGSYIQASISDVYLPGLNIQSTDKVLDIGCGPATYSVRVLTQFPVTLFFGIDTSENMLKMARDVTKNIPNTTFQRVNVENMHFKNEFSYVISFWCLQWTHNIKAAFSHIYQALDTGGKLFALFPTGDDGYIHSYYTIKKSGYFPELDNFHPPIDYVKFNHLENIIAKSGFKKFNVVRDIHQIALPSLGLYQQFVNAIPFFQGQIKEDVIARINQAMVNEFYKKCLEQHQGQLIFQLTVYCVRAEK